MQITINAEDVLHYSYLLKEKASNYDQLIQDLYNRMQEMQTIWKGEDNIAFTDQINSFRPQLKQMSDIILQYATYLETSANQYQQLQQERAASARRLA